LKFIADDFVFAKSIEVGVAVGLATSAASNGSWFQAPGVPLSPQALFKRAQAPYHVVLLEKPEGQYHNVAVLRNFHHKSYRLIDILIR